MTDTVTELVDEPIELAKYTLPLDPADPEAYLYVEVPHWAAQDATDESPGYPAETHILLGEYIPTGFVQLTPDKARALVPLLHTFADQLSKAADMADAFIAEHQAGAQC